MNLNILFENSTISSVINKDISIKELINELKNSPKTKDWFKDYSLTFLNSNNELLKDDYIVSINKEKEQTLYLSSVKKPKQEQSNIVQEPIEDLLMKVTGAKTKVKPARMRSSGANAFEQLMESALTNLNNTGSTTVNIRANQLSQLQNLLRSMINPGNGEVIINPIGIHHGGSSNSANFVVSEEGVAHLLEMGFSDADARRALRMSRNNLNRATDILISGSLDYMPHEQ